MKSFTVVLIKTTRRGEAFSAIQLNPLMVGSCTSSSLPTHAFAVSHQSVWYICRINLQEIDDEGKEGNDGEHEGEDGLGCRAAVAALYCAAAATSL